MPFLPQQMPFLQTSKSATSPVMGAIRCLSIWASLKPTEEVVPTLSAKDRVTNDPWQQMRYPVFIHFFSWLKLRFFLIVLSTSCLWLYWRVDWIKFDDPQKSFLGKWCLRRWKKKVMNLLSLHAKCHVNHLFGLHFSKCGQSKSDYSIGCVVRGLTWILSLNTVGMWG